MRLPRVVCKWMCWILPLCLPTAVRAIDSFSTYESAEFYHNHSLQQWNVAYMALREYPFQGHESILEIGCRGGKVAANLAGRVPAGQVVATEMRGSGAIQFAQHNYAKDLYPNLSFLEQDFLQLDYKDHFDLAVSFSALHWYVDQQNILQKVYIALKDNGKILFTIPGKPLPIVNAIMTELMNSETWKQYFASYDHPRKKFTVDEYTALLAEVGFKSIDIKMQRCEYRFENKRALINWFSAFSPLLDCIPADKREEFLVDFANIYTKCCPIQTDGQIHFQQDELFIQAVK